MQTQMEPHVPLNPEGNLHQGNGVNQDGSPTVASSSLNNVVPQLPAKKPTRKWAAWTHQEEESFFTALRQVGKNFEKITSRVQSKNKDQVRHYYYRLVRRMNKLLGPELSLDAKNPKDTNTAMLRWWSLLEKYSCKASKLHLKPRRFKLFIEALEHQMLKDRKKNVRKRACQGENSSSASLGNVLNQSRERGADNRSFKLILVDSQNIKKLGHGKGSINHGDEKEDMTTGKGARQQRKSGVASAAFRKWEKAAMAGVSLVADAAEHLERISVDKDIDCEQGLKSRSHIGKPPCPLLSSDQNLLVEGNMQSAVKLKLQLFPIDDGTRRALEMDKHNPYLELTLSNRKKISSVLEHLNRKWGNSSSALGELMMFPYSARKENVMCQQRWTQDSFLSAADVHSMVGSPSVFRLRYGWFVRTASGSLISQAPTSASSTPVEHDMEVEDRDGPIMESVATHVPSTAEQLDRFTDLNQNLLFSDDKFHPHPREPKDKFEGSISAINIPWNRKETANITSNGQLEDVDDMHVSNGDALSAGEWADSLTNISVGDLLSEVPDNMEADCIDPPVAEGFQCLQHTPFSSDSFDAAIAAHILRHQSKSGLPPVLASHSSSMWDDEETRDAFSFQCNRIPEVPQSSGVSFSGVHEDTDKVNDEPAHLVEESPDTEEAMEYPADGDRSDEAPPDPHMMETSGKTLTGLADVYWPDSLGPLDIEIRSSKYNSEDLILSDSLGSLSRLIASSLDTFQSCSLFGLDKKDQASIVGP